jgi:hypothetical protein
VVADASSQIDELFEGANPIVRTTYDAIVAELAAIGPFTEEVRQGSIHLAHSVTFASVHPYLDHLILTMRTDQPIDHEHVQRSEQVSDSRWQIEVSLSSPADVGDQVRGWLSAAMELT